MLFGCFCFTMLGCLLVTEATAGAQGVVSCKYLKAGGRHIELELQVTGTVPVTVIVLQNLPPEVKIVRSKPAMKKYNQKNGQAKWLLKNVSPGKVKVTMELDKSIMPGQISGKLRYRSPDGGAMETMLISP
jgi:hypothetical protein